MDSRLPIAGALPPAPVSATWLASVRHTRAHRRTWIGGWGTRGRLRGLAQCSDPAATSTCQSWSATACMRARVQAQPCRQKVSCCCPGSQVHASMPAPGKGRACACAYKHPARHARRCLAKVRMHRRTPTPREAHVPLPGKSAQAQEHAGNRQSWCALPTGLHVCDHHAVTYVRVCVCVVCACT